MATSVSHSGPHYLHDTGPFHLLPSPAATTWGPMGCESPDLSPQTQGLHFHQSRGQKLAVGQSSARSPGNALSPLQSLSLVHPSPTPIVLCPPPLCWRRHTGLLLFVLICSALAEPRGHLSGAPGGLLALPIWQPLNTWRLLALNPGGFGVSSRLLIACRFLKVGH